MQNPGDKIVDLEISWSVDLTTVGHYIRANETTHFTGGSAGELQFIAVSTAGAGVITLDTFDGG